MVAILDPANEICPECGKRVSSILNCIVNGFYYDTVFMHWEKVSFSLPDGEILTANAPRFCGPSVMSHADVDVDLRNKVIRITQ